MAKQYTILEYIARKRKQLPAGGCQAKPFDITKAEEKYGKVCNDLVRVIRQNKPDISRGVDRNEYVHIPKQAIVCIP